MECRCHCGRELLGNRASLKRPLHLVSTKLSLVHSHQYKPCHQNDLQTSLYYLLSLCVCRPAGNFYSSVMMHCCAPLLTNLRTCGRNPWAYDPIFIWWPSSCVICCFISSILSFCSTDQLSFRTCLAPACNHVYHHCCFATRPFRLRLVEKSRGSWACSLCFTPNTCAGSEFVVLLPCPSPRSANAQEQCSFAIFYSSSGGMTQNPSFYVRAACSMSLLCRRHPVSVYQDACWPPLCCLCYIEYHHTI